MPAGAPFRALVPKQGEAAREPASVSPLTATRAAKDVGAQAPLNGQCFPGEITFSKQGACYLYHGLRSQPAGSTPGEHHGIKQSLNLRSSFTGIHIWPASTRCWKPSLEPGPRPQPSARDTTPHQTPVELPGPACQSPALDPALPALSRPCRSGRTRAARGGLSRRFGPRASWEGTAARPAGK